MSRIGVFVMLLAVCSGNWGTPAAPHPLPKDEQTWWDDYDLDGDGKNDRIEIEFSGGVHCCYKIGATLTSTEKTIMLPFWMDGGYIYPMTLLDKPNHFRVRTAEGKLPEILMEIATYNGRPEPLETEWKRRYGIKTHRIGISFPNGKVRVRDVWDWPS
jgi:hypothetical protein